MTLAFAGDEPRLQESIQVQANPVGVEAEGDGELVGPSGATQLSQRSEDPRTGRMGDGVVCEGGSIHRPILHKQTWKTEPIALYSQRPWDNKGGGRVAYVINEPCIGTKDTSCVDVCPVDCIHPTSDEPDFADAKQLFIDPEECIDCDACIEACPVDAITPLEQVPPEWESYIELNAEYYRRQAAS